MRSLSPGPRAFEEWSFNALVHESCCSLGPSALCGLSMAAIYPSTGWLETQPPHCCIHTDQTVIAAQSALKSHLQTSKFSSGDSPLSENQGGTGVHRGSSSPLVFQRLITSLFLKTALCSRFKDDESCLLKCHQCSVSVQESCGDKTETRERRLFFPLINLNKYDLLAFICLHF